MPPKQGEKLKGATPKTGSNSADHSYTRASDPKGKPCQPRKSRLVQSNKVAKIRNRYNQVPHLTQDTNGKVTNSQKTPQTRAKRSALSQQVTTKHI